MDRDAMKRAAAERAVADVKPGMVVGLGSGSTAEIANGLYFAYSPLAASRVTTGHETSGVPVDHCLRIDAGSPTMLEVLAESNSGIGSRIATNAYQGGGAYGVLAYEAAGKLG